MLLKLGGPYHGYRNGEIIELPDEEGQTLFDHLGGSPRIEILGDLRLPPPATEPTAEEIAAEQQRLADEAAAADDDDDD